MISVLLLVHSFRIRTFPYDVSRVGPLWLMLNAPRRNSS